jgi:hypothetical protein
LITRHAHADTPNTGAPASPPQWPDDPTGTRQPRAAITGKHPTEHEPALAARELRDPVFANLATGRLVRRPAVVPPSAEFVLWHERGYDAGADGTATSRLPIV